MERMKTTMEKYEIINLKIQGWSNSKISNTFRVSRNTIRKYWDEYQSKLKLAIENNPGINVRTLIEEIVSKPHYDTSSRTSRKYNEEIDLLLETILKEENQKKERLGSTNKQMLTKHQIYELIKSNGFDISETTIRNKINEKLNIQSEAYIKQEYEYGQRFEYDFGEVKLIINGKNTKAYLAVLTAPASGFRWAYLYHNSKMDVFLDSQVRFFEMLKGSFLEGVYDNMKNVVIKFIGRNEKQLNEQLIKLATYYGFEINVTNCYSGNEKGNVEGAVKYIRNKVFAIKYQFDSFKQAEEYLQIELIKLNKNSLIDEEKKHLTAYRPKYEVANIMLCHVNKYSFIQIDTNFYSVPDSLVDKHLLAKVYPNDIDVYYKNNIVASHQRIVGKNKTCIDIKHYLNTFLRKPGALRNSTALNSVPELKDIFNKYFKTNPKDFIKLLYEHRDLDIEEIIQIIKTDKCIRVDSNQTKLIIDAVNQQISTISNMFIKGEYNVH